MTNNELIKQLRALKCVTPDKQWADLTLNRLLSGLEENKAARSILSDLMSKILQFNAQGRAASYYTTMAMAVFVLMIGSFSMIYGGLVSSDIDRIAASLYFSKAQKVKIIVENAENVVGSSTAVEVEKIAQDSGASYVPKAANTTNNVNDSNAETPGQNSEQIYTVVFKEGSDSKERFTRLLRERIEAKLYELSQSIKDRDENTKQQIGSVLKDAGEAFGRGELIEALELVSAAEKSLKSSGN